MVKEIVAKATVGLVQRGVRDASRGKYHLGPALQWSRLNYAERALAMRGSAQESLGSPVVPTITNRDLVIRVIEEKKILFLRDLPVLP